MLNHHCAAPWPPVGVVLFFALQIHHPRLLMYFNTTVLHLCQSSFSIATRTSNCLSISISFYKQDSVSLFGSFTISNLSIFNVSSPSCPTTSLSGDKVRHLRYAACCLTTIMLRVGYADISHTISHIINSQIIKSNERAWPIIYLWVLIELTVHQWSLRLWSKTLCTQSYIYLHWRDFPPCVCWWIYRYHYHQPPLKIEVHHHQRPSSWEVPRFLL